jgi:hypothetical protein
MDTLYWGNLGEQARAAAGQQTSVGHCSGAAAAAFSRTNRLSSRLILLRPRYVGLKSKLKGVETAANATRLAPSTDR